MRKICLKSVNQLPLTYYFPTSFLDFLRAHDLLPPSSVFRCVVTAGYDGGE